MMAAEAVLSSKVLVALDGSPAAARVLPLARQVARQIGALVEAVYVTDEALPPQTVWRRLGEQLEPGESLHVVARAGEPAGAILQLMDCPKVALLVLTTSGEGLGHGRQLGSVARAVIAGTTRPILIARPEALPVSIPPLQRLLLPLDGTPGTASALRPVVQLARRLGAALDVLYVVGQEAEVSEEPGSLPAPLYIDQPQHEWPGWMREVTTRLCAGLARCPSGLSVETFLARGEIGAEIAQFAALHSEDVVVLVRRSRLEPGRARALMAVLESMPCPALLVGGPPSVKRPRYSPNLLLPYPLLEAAGRRVRAEARAE